MKRKTLQEYLNGTTQYALAQAVGVTQGAINKMLHSDRDIVVITHRDGTIELHEHRIVAAGTLKRAA